MILPGQQERPRLGDSVPRGGGSSLPLRALALSRHRGVCVSVHFWLSSSPASCVECIGAEGRRFMFSIWSVFCHLGLTESSEHAQ